MARAASSSALLVVLACLVAAAAAQTCSIYSQCDGCITGSGCAWDPYTDRCVTASPSSDYIVSSNDCLCHNQYKSCDSCTSSIAAICYWCDNGSHCRGVSSDASCSSAICPSDIARGLAGWIIAVIVISILVVVIILPPGFASAYIQKSPTAIIIACCCCVAAAASAGSSHSTHGVVHSTASYTAMPAQQPVYTAPDAYPPQQQAYAPQYGAPQYGAPAPQYAAPAYAQPVPPPKYV